jgi:predicted MPP superfamily phosphohydrolase
MSYLQQINPVVLLVNEKTVFNKEIEIVWIDYNSSKYQLRDELKKIELSDDKFSILLYHEPKGINYGIEKGFDLILIWHTHGGQIFPITKIVDYIYEFSDGLYERWKTKIYTTDGAWLYWPKMRLWSQNEIVVFKIKAE